MWTIVLWILCVILVLLGGFAIFGPALLDNDDEFLKIGLIFIAIALIIWFIWLRSPTQSSQLRNQQVKVIKPSAQRGVQSSSFNKENRETMSITLDKIKKPTIKIPQ